ncbi:hypothetical protein [Paenibacillus tepidiphilus]|uniref:hypothetical protein n=1 Tax=Paenibacillus tepidiphilus TaxID=2608683 RepID=UPI001239DD05|nr:hypothetical protein [Paenibacillus tepidiphilus]
MFQNIIAAVKLHLFGIEKTTISKEIEVTEEDLISIKNIDLIPVTVQDEEKKESLSVLVRTLYYVIEIQEEFEYFEYRNNWDRNNAAVSILLSWLWNSSRGIKDVEISLLNSWGKQEVYKLKAFFTDT